MSSAILIGGGAFAAALTILSLSWRNQRLRRELGETREMLGSARGVALEAAPLVAVVDGWLALPSRTALDALWDWDVPADRIRFSARWRELVGLSAAEIHRSTEEWWGRIHPSDRAQLQADIASQLTGTGAQFSSEHRVRHEDGRWLLLHWMGVIQRGADDRAERITGSVRDTTSQRSVEERQRREALYDALTGLPNRSLAIDLLRRAIQRTRRQGERRFAVLYVDLDRFNILNDSLGHQAGDEILRGVADRLRTAIRPGDTIARLSGDEFLLLLDDVTEFEDAEIVADRVQFVLAEPLPVLTHEVAVTASVGIVLHDSSMVEPTDYLRDAALAMQSAKRAGRARHERFVPEMRDGVRRRVSLEQDFRGAIDRNEFSLRYQPIWATDGPTERLVGFEALLRWNHPVRGTLSPGEFIPIAEETEMIVSLGGWTLHRACLDLRDFSSPGPEALWVSVNIAARQLANRGLVAMVENVLHATGLDASRLKLEVTENVILHDERTAIEVLESLGARGVRALMDDFGTGHASLTYLHRLPIRTIKIDRYFVGRMDVSPQCLEIVRSIITLAKSLGMEIVAEGVEHEAQLEQLRDLECRAVQGYLFGRPLLAEEAQALVAGLERSPGECPRALLQQLGLSGGLESGHETSALSVVAA